MAWVPFPESDNFLKEVSPRGSSSKETTCFRAAKWSSLPHNLQLFKRVVVWSNQVTLELSPLILESPQSPNYRFAKLFTDHNTLILRSGSWFPLARTFRCLVFPAEWSGVQLHGHVCPWPPMHCDHLGSQRLCLQAISRSVWLISHLWESFDKSSTCSFILLPLIKWLSLTLNLGLKLYKPCHVILYTNCLKVPAIIPGTWASLKNCPHKFEVHKPIVFNNSRAKMFKALLFRRMLHFTAPLICIGKRQHSWRTTYITPKSDHCMIKCWSCLFIIVYFD